MLVNQSRSFPLSGNAMAPPPVVPLLTPRHQPPRPTTGRVRRLRAFLDAIIHPRTVTMTLRVGRLAKECLTMADTRVHVRHLNSFPRFAICRSSNTSKWKPTPNSAGSATMSTRPCRQPAETAANLDAWQGLHLKPLFFLKASYDRHTKSPKPSRRAAVNILRR